LLRLDKWPKGKLATKFMQWLRTPAKTFRSGAKLKYFYQDLDSAGQRQNGTNRYTVTFPKDQNALASMAAAAALLLVSVSDLTLAQQHEEPSLLETPNASIPAEVARLPTEVRGQIEAVLRTCKSPVGVAGDLSRYREKVTFG
jgi:hypothetical protein